MESRKAGVDERICKEGMETQMQREDCGRSGGGTEGHRGEGGVDVRAPSESGGWLHKLLCSPGTRSEMTWRGFQGGKGGSRGGMCV